MSNDNQDAKANVSLRAIVVGGTGAIGKSLVDELARSNNFSSITTIGRREVPLKEDVPRDKVVQKVIDMDKMSEHKNDFDNHDVAFCCLGTTRADAGSAEAFRKVDLEYVVEFARLCKESNIPHFNLVTSTGADPNSWFLYMKTKGEAEEGVKKLGFNRVSIFRPGMLDRGEDARFKEKFFSVFTGSIKVSKVANAMKNIAIQQAAEPKNNHIDYFSNSDILKLCSSV
mmetsp:Transcript_12588/g.17422  ORF Transcript_12588/g.17422 Transcript_12588/m.17422 type:complete len:228 (+) Transcript_12588:106-789(+)